MSASLDVSARCARCESPLESDDLRCAICGLKTPGDREAPRATLAEVLRCDGCGAAVSYAVEVQAPRCAFCDAVMHVETPEDPMEAAELFVPFGFDRVRAQAVLRAWLGRQGFFVPSDLAREATVDSLTPLWFAAWIVSAESLVSWAADSDAGAGAADWAPKAGQGPIDLENLLIGATRGLTRKEVSALTPRYRLADAAPTPEGPSDARVERFDLERSAARRTVLEIITRHAQSTAEKSWIPGRRIRNVRVSVLLRRMVNRRFGLPVWILAYRYRGRLFRAVIHGQDPETILGEAPRSKLKIAAVWLAAIGLVAALVYLFG